MDRESIIRKAQEEFAERLNSELDRIELMKQEAEPKDYSKLEKSWSASCPATAPARS
jgi:hypothetical protein